MSNNVQKIVPYRHQSGSKKSQVKQMFDNIAGRYDFLNHFLSAGTDRLWRRKALRKAAPQAGTRILDVACGTGDLSFEALKYQPESLTGIDLSENMLAIARAKLPAQNARIPVSFECGDCEHLPYPDNSFGLVMAAFGVRNFENLDRGLTEMVRVLVPGGKLMILEFSQPTNKIINFIFRLYFKHILPFVGRLVSGDSSAYTYLPESVGAFPSGRTFAAKLEQAGLSATTFFSLSGGIASIYIGQKSKKEQFFL